METGQVWVQVFSTSLLLKNEVKQTEAKSMIFHNWVNPNPQGWWNPPWLEFTAGPTEIQPFPNSKLIWIDMNGVIHSIHGVPYWLLVTGISGYNCNVLFWPSNIPLTFGLALSGRGETSRTRLGQPLAAQKKCAAIQREKKEHWQGDSIFLEKSKSKVQKVQNLG